MEDAAETAFTRECIEGGALVGDSGKAGTIGSLLPEPGELGGHFDSGSALAGGDEECAVEVEAGFESEQLLGVGGIGHVEVESASGRSQGGVEDASGQAGPAHPHEDDIREALGGDLAGEGGQVRRVLEALLGGAEEAEAVADLCGIGLPDGVVAHPEAPHDLVVAEGLKALLDGAGDVAEGVGGGGLAAGGSREAAVELGHERLVAVLEGGEPVD